jgi:FkbM family methyltransferase
MTLAHIKTLLLASIGSNLTSYIQALRFAYMIKAGLRSPDPEVGLLKYLLNNGDVAVDVGANGADWLYQLYQIVGDDGYIFAFEADPYYALATERAVKILGLRSVRLFPFGLSNKNEDALLRIAETGSGVRYAGLAYVDKVASSAEKNVLPISLKTLDMMTSDNPMLLKSRLIKCDVEGYEFFVFQGCEKVLEIAKPIIILEIGHFEKHGYSANDLHAFLSEFGYRGFVITENKELAQVGPDMQHAQAASHNRIFVPPGTQIPARLCC